MERGKPRRRFPLKSLCTAEALFHSVSAFVAFQFTFLHKEIPFEELLVAIIEGHRGTVF